VRYLLALWLIAAALPLGAEPVLRWVDEQGRVHYGDRPPSRSAATVLPLPATPAASNEVAPPAPGSDALLPPGSVVEGDLALDAAQQRRLCQQAGDNLALFRDGRRLRLRDAQSDEFRFLTEAERSRELARAEQQQRRYCDR